jgi:hypothetical protein
MCEATLGSYVWRLAVESGLPGWEGIAAGMGISALVLSGVLLTTIRIRRPEKTIVSQMVIYAIGLWVLFAGTLISIFAGALMSVVVQAGAILTVSDTLVLIRMGAGWKKESMGQRRTLLAFLIIILLLYYWFYVSDDGAVKKRRRAGRPGGVRFIWRFYQNSPKHT